MKKQYKETIEYYNKNAADYIGASPCAGEMLPTYNMVLPYLKTGDTILDFGCGHGRDTIFFQNHGFQTYSYDASDTMCNIAKSNGAHNVKKQDFMSLDDIKKFDLVWAYAALLHLQTSDIQFVFEKIYEALKDNGIFFCNFKHGDFQGLRNNRFYSDINKSTLEQIISNTRDHGKRFTVQKIWLSDDVRTNGKKSSRQWLNCILQKQNFR